LANSCTYFSGLSRHYFGEEYKTMSRRSVAILMTGSVAVLAACLWFAFRGPAVWLSLQMDKVEAPEFSIRTLGINGITGFYVWSETKNEFLWGLYLGNSPSGSITYGKVPAKAEQTYPKNGSAPRNLEPGERFVIEVSYQYDTWMAACAAVHYFRFEADLKGTIRAIGDSKFIPGPKMPE
jgi:hypothetical protein